MAELIQGMAPEEYFAIDALSSSQIRSMAKPRPQKHFNPSPALLKALQDGNLVDWWETDRDRFHANTIPEPINPKTDRPYGETTKAWAEYEVANPGKIVCSEAKLKQIRRMSEALHAQPEYEAAYHQASFQDVILFEYKGHPAKAMLDLRVGTEQVIDIKTARSADYWGFYRSARDLGYDIQAYWYRAAMFSVFGLTPDFMFAVVDKDPIEPQAALYTIEPAECVPDWVDSLVERVLADDWALPESKQINHLNIPRDFQGEPVTFGGKEMGL